MDGHTVSFLSLQCLVLFQRQLEARGFTFEHGPRTACFYMMTPTRAFEGRLGVSSPAGEHLFYTRFRATFASQFAAEYVPTRAEVHLDIGPPPPSASLPPGFDHVGI